MLGILQQADEGRPKIAMSFTVDSDTQVTATAAHGRNDGEDRPIAADLDLLLDENFTRGIGIDTLAVSSAGGEVPV
jgi:hypothetical protein